LDGASFHFIDPLLKEGKLPNLRYLMENGSFGPLKSFQPTISPILWTTIATGKDYRKHGIGSFTAFKDGKPVPVSSSLRRTKAFWNIVSDYGLRVGVVNWWVTWPPEKVNGFIVSDHYREKRYRDQPDLTYPAELAAQLPLLRMSEAEFAKERERAGLPENLHPAASSNAIEDLVGHYKGYWLQDKEMWEISDMLLRKNNVDVFGIVFRIVDVSSHLFWMYVDPHLIQELRAKEDSGTPLSPEDTARIDLAYAHVLAPIYTQADKILGQFRQLAGSDANFIICSDHGFKFEQGRYGHEGFDVPPDGILILSGPAFRHGVHLSGASLLNVTPTLLYMEGIPVGRDMDGKPLFAAIRSEYIKAHPLLMVASHDKGFHQKGEPASSDLDKDILDDFKALGYIH
jgi:predicted AlkP superfamily phosphohydrolase/phosphomutase